MLALQQIRPNFVKVENNKGAVYFSYNTIVAFESDSKLPSEETLKNNKDKREELINLFNSNRIFATDEFHSNTTSRHINSLNATKIPEEIFNFELKKITS